VPTKMFLSYRLKPDTDVNEFLEWSTAVDQPFTNKLEGVYRFDVYQAAEPAGDGQGPLFFEDIWVESKDHWEALLATDEVKPMVETWKTFADEGSALLVTGDRVI
jgi:quinol monooxygenase YgiN